MKIAVAYADGQVFQHFGHAPQFKIYTVESKMILHTEVVDTPGSGHGAVVGFLRGLGVDTVLCGGLGSHAAAALEGAGIRLYPGVTASPDQAVLALLAGILTPDPTAIQQHCGHCH